MQDPLYTASLELADEAATVRLGRLLAPCLAKCAQENACQVWLQGDLGAGKTSLARAVLRELGVKERIKSPTYSLLELYVVSELYLYHFDFYRIESPDEFLEAGFDECFQRYLPTVPPAPSSDETGRRKLLLVEWPEKAAAHLPLPDFQVQLSYPGADRHEGRDVLLATIHAGACSCLKTVASRISKAA